MWGHRTLWFVAVGACQSTGPSVEHRPQVAAPARVAIDASTPDAAVDTSIDAAVAVMAPPEQPKPYKAESWVLVRRDDKLMTPFACTSTIDGKVNILAARRCAPLEGASLATVDSRGKSVSLTRSSEPISCRPDDSTQSQDRVAFEVVGGKSPPIALYPKETAKPPLAPLDKRWTPKPDERKAIFETRGGSKLDALAIANLDNDPELERLAIVSSTEFTAVGHGQTSGQIKTVTQTLLLDEGDKTFEVIVAGRPQHIGLDFKISVATTTDLDGDGFRELWLELDDGSRLWEVYEVSDEDGGRFVEDCRYVD